LRTRFIASESLPNKDKTRHKSENKDKTHDTPGETRHKTHQESHMQPLCLALAHSYRTRAHEHYLHLHTLGQEFKRAEPSLAQEFKRSRVQEVKSHLAVGEGIERRFFIHSTCDVKYINILIYESACAL
jgi:hypothetical protein